MAIQARTCQCRSHKTTSTTNLISISDGYATHMAIFMPWYTLWIGSGHIFIGFKKSWLDGKTIKTYWRTPHGSGNEGRLEILDGYYDRASMTDFPDQGARIVKGNGSLWSHSHFSYTDWHTDEVTFSASGASQEYVTFFVSLIDASSSTSGYLDLSWIEIWQGASKVWSAYFGSLHLGEPTWEVSGTQNDYGYLGNIWHEEIKIVRELSVGKKLVLPTDEGGHWILGFWVPHVRNRLTKIRASDHNTSRTILQRARDIAKAQIGEA